mmetsp:Transcript_12391/g.35983  ORF Transcript_12391/g.35983 Transcript_12391/m.35983 type:complete len:880 (+) Transcript_12391:205-2844(+)
MPTTTLLGPSVLLALLSARQVIGHGYMFDPPSRNYVAHDIGIDPGNPSQVGIPSAEYCPHCLNTNSGLCGISEQHGKDGAFGDYDAWLDSTKQNPMPWMSQESYLQGGHIIIRSKLLSHHAGHIEVRACSMGRESTIECMEEHALTFVEDLAFGMPADPNYPERGYLYGGAGWNGYTFVMEFKLPDDLFGNQVLLQWRYVTANSCSPIGYDKYFAANPDLSDHFWNSRLEGCPETLPFNSDAAPEQFFNCAEVSVFPSSIEIEDEADDGDDEGEGNGDDADDANDEEPDHNAPPISDEGGESPITVTSTIPTTNQQPPQDDAVTDAAPKDYSPSLVAFMGNWLPCPSIEQYQHYTHVMIAFAVSYRWRPGKNDCSSTCDIPMPPICGGPDSSTFVQDLQDAGKKVLVSFGGAGMGGSWPTSEDDCWEHCFGREDQVINQLVGIVQELNLDGVDIDYEYFYEDNQRDSGFDRGDEAQYFIKTVTQGLRARLPTEEGYLITHTPMDIDMQPDTAYFDILREIRDDVDFVMPQYYNGITRPALDGVTNSRGAYPSTLQHFTTIATEMLDGDATKILAGFCIGDCAETASNVNGAQAAKVMLDLAKELDSGCPGGVFFWVATDDLGGAWSSQVREAMSGDEWPDECAAVNHDDDDSEVTTATPTEPSIGNDPTIGTLPPTASPTGEIQKPDSPPLNPSCVPCVNGSHGECQKPSDGHCWPYPDPNTRVCYVGTIDCSSSFAEEESETTTTTAPSDTSTSTITSTTGIITTSAASTRTSATTTSSTATTPPPIIRNDGNIALIEEDLSTTACGLEWEHCKISPSDTRPSCCPDYECVEYDEHTSMCRPIVGQCLPKGDPCDTGDQLACCYGLSCVGDEHYSSCQ